MDVETIGTCWHCGRDLAKYDYGRETLCQGCGKATRVCRNCRHYAPGRPYACLEPLSEPVQDKEHANFCDLFAPGDRYGGGFSGDQAASLLRRAQDLFK